MAENEKRERNRMGQQPSASETSTAPSVSPSTPGAAAPGGAEGKPESLLPSLTLPKGGGAIRGIGEKFTTSAPTGTGALSVPIATSPGRAGFQFGLTLDYDSGAGNGPFGIGWHLSAPAITRKTDKGLPRYANDEGDDEGQDVFILSGAEDLVPVRVPDGAGTRLDVVEHGGYRVQRYRPRVEGLFPRIERWTQRTTGDMHWRVTTRDNTLNVYGRDPRARIADPARPERVFSWLLEETRDDRGNVARYTYKAEDATGVDVRKASESNRFDRARGGAGFLATAQRYPKRIQYGNRVPVARDAAVPTRDEDWLFEVVFDYGEHDDAAPTPAEAKAWPVRADPFSTYRATFEVRTYRLCRRVLMFHRFAELGPGPVLVRSTDFTYDQGPVITYLTSVTHAGYLRKGAAYQRAVMPSLDLQYIRPVVHDEVRTIDRKSLAGVEDGIDGNVALWVDLDGEGIPGVLIPTERAWYYKSNRGGGKLDPPALLRELPSPARIRGGAQQLTDLGSDGNLDLVQYTPPLSGFFERTQDRAFEPFVPLSELPNIDWNDPNLRFLDIDGDGLADVLITENDAYVWYRSRGKDGFEHGGVVPHAKDEVNGPAVIFADGTETIHLADMSGDGLVDIVRVRYGEVCYWPNLGYGRFGQRVTLDASPRFDAPDLFDPQRVRFTDIDGSGTSDIVYLGRNGVRLYFNQSGNGFSPPRSVESLPAVDGLSILTVADLLGQGTACLVLSTPLPDPQARRVSFVDLMGGKKPHLLESVVNNLGAETRITYAPSTKFYLADKAAGIPWLTRLSFPVQVVERIDHIDGISKSHLVSTYSYRHGFFDGVEREFRGFARIEQTDAEAFALGSLGTELFQPPTRTVSWFHTGAWLEKERIEAALEKEYFQGGPPQLLLPDTILPSGMTIQDEREAARALRGYMLHQELYANDADVVGAEVAATPFALTEQTFEVRMLQSSKGRRHGIFLAFPRETISVHMERRAADLRVTHEFILDVDDFANVTRKAAVAYARAVPVEPEQAKVWATLGETSFINHTGDDFYRLSLFFDDKSFELTGLPNLPLAGQGLLARADLAAAIANIDAAHDLPYDATPPADGATARRMLAHKHQLYYDNDTTGAILGAAALGQTGSLALPFETYELALTTGLVAEMGTGAAALSNGTFDPTTLPGVLLGTDPGQGHYVQRPADSGYWTASGRVIFDPHRFYLPIEAIDPFGQRHFVTYDRVALLPEATQDPLGNIERAVNDYRVLGPAQITDANLNRVAVAFDALGMVTARAVLGKEIAPEGDTLAAPTVQIVYDLLRWQNPNPAARLPAMVHTIAREIHGQASPVQHSYTYSDGFGRVVMQKVQAEPGDVPGVGQVATRWIGTGRTVFNNKGNPVKQYEPFFSATFEFEDETVVVQSGVTPIIHYDAIGRVVRTEFPNGTFSRMAFDAWQQESSDVNDTILESTWYSRRGSPPPAGPEPQNDPEARAAWLAAQHAGTSTVTHFDTLGRPFLAVQHNRASEDGGPFGDVFYRTRTTLDIAGNALAIADARQDKLNPTSPLPTLARRFDVLARPQRSDSADGGLRLLLVDVAGKPLLGWDSRGQITTHRYDALQRPSHRFVQATAATSPPQDLSNRLLMRTVYGEALDPAATAGPPTPTPPTPSAAQALNLRGRAFRVYDCAGSVTHDSFDFKGNPISSTRRLARDYRAEPKWNATTHDLTDLTDPVEIQSLAEVLLDPATTTPLLTVFTVLTEYDALNRVTRRTTPDESVTVPTYNAAGLLEKLQVGVHGGAFRTVIHNIDYNARGQRLLYEYADPTNGATDNVTCQTAYTYDPLTFRLATLVTTRVNGNSRSQRLQHLVYTNDPIGNIVELDDLGVFSTSVVSSKGRYRYDAVYRLVQATGREHPGQVGAPPGPTDALASAIPNPNDLQALVGYTESYSYDRVGNIEKMGHIAGQGAIRWTRRYQYATTNNRLAATSRPGSSTDFDSYDYTAHGSMKTMPHLTAIDWDYADRMQHTNLGGGGDVFFTYDGGGERVRKVWDHGNNIFDERIYVGGWETFRHRVGAANAGPVSLERETLHVMDDRRRIAMVETKTVDTTRGARPTSPRWRFQLDNHLGSSILELDAGGNIITYEVYHPYGTTAFQATDRSVSAKRYRYAGKEKDDETGLYFHGARYYASWLGRWISPDPVGLIDGPNLYSYVKDSPIGHSDPTGTKTDPAHPAEPRSSARPPRARGTPAIRPSSTSPPHAAAPSLLGRIGDFFASIGRGIAAGAKAVVGAIGKAALAAASGLRAASEFARNWLPGLVAAPIGGAIGVIAGLFRMIGGVFSGKTQEILGGLKDIGLEAASIIGIKEAISEKWVGPDPHNPALGTDSLVAPPTIRKDIEYASKQIPADANKNGMHAWHAATNAAIVNRVGPVAAPLIWLAGLLHETPADPGSFAAEQYYQWTVNHILDSSADIVANTFGDLLGLLLPKKLAIKAAAVLGNYIPGPGEPDPAFGGTGPYATNPNASPSQAWGQYPQFPPKAPNPPR